MMRKIIAALSVLFALSLSVLCFSSCLDYGIYTVSFETDGGTAIETQQVENGSTVTKPADPTKDGFNFGGWYLGEEEYDFSTAVESDITLTAKWSEIVVYTIIWKNYDGTALETDVLTEGTLPVYDGETPEKPADNTYTYEFSGWDAEVVSAAADAEYTAVYTATYIDYTVTFFDEDGTTKLGEKTDYHYGDDVVLPEDPSKPATAQYTYTFNGWTPDVTAVTANATYTATYSETVNKYTVKWMDGETELDSEVYEYGVTPEYKGETPTKAADSDYSYSFNGWDKEIAAVTGDATYTAVYLAFGGTYVIPFDMYSVYQDCGAHYDAGEGQVQVVQHPWNGYYSLKLAGDNWAALKAIAAEHGYTKIVLTIYGTTSDITFYTANGYGAECLQLTGSGTYPVRHVNNFADYANESEIFAIIASTYWECSTAQSVTFSVTLEKYTVTAGEYITGSDKTFGFDALNASVSSSTGTVDGLTYEDFTVTSLDTDIVTYSDGVFTTKAEGKATIRIEYKGCITYTNVTVLGSVYTVPFGMYSVYHDNGTYSDKGDGKVQVVQHPWNGYYSLKLAGDNWAALKALAEENGYTKIVLTIYSTTSDITFYTANGYGAECLQLTGSGALPVRHVNNFADYANESEIFAIIASTYWTCGTAQAVTFSVSLEKYGVSANDQTIVEGETFNFDDLGVTVTGKDGALSGLTYEDFTVTCLDTGVVSFENGVFTANAKGSTTVQIAYKGCVATVKVNVTEDIYVVPFSMYNVCDNNGTYSDDGDGKVYVVQHPWNGWFSLYFTVANWTELKQIAENKGYTKIVLTINGMTSNMTLSTADIYGDKVLQLTGSGDEYPVRHVNNISDYANESEIFVIVAATYWEVGSAQAVNFTVTLEK